LPLSNSTQTFKSESFQEYRLDANRLVKQKSQREGWWQSLWFSFDVHKDKRRTMQSKGSKK